MLTSCICGKPVDPGRTRCPRCIQIEEETALAWADWEATVQAIVDADHAPLPFMSDVDDPDVDEWLFDEADKPTREPIRQQMVRGIGKTRDSLRGGGG